MDTTDHEFEQITVRGASIAGEHSTIYVPQLKLSFDMGIITKHSFKASTVCITHGHADHIGALHMHALLRFHHKLAPPTYLMPAGCVTEFIKALSAYSTLNGMSQPPPYYLVAVKNTTVFILGNRKVKSIRTDHSVPSYGYVVVEMRKKLKEQHHGKTSHELSSLAAAGEQLSYEIEHPLIAYTGDTAIDAIMANDQFLTADVLCIEGTFLDDANRAQAYQHVNLNDIAANIEKFRNKHLVIYHTSTRYTQDEVRRFIETNISPHIDVFVI